MNIVEMTLFKLNLFGTQAVTRYFSSKTTAANTLEEIGRWLVILSTCIYLISWGHAIREIAWYGAPVCILLVYFLKKKPTFPKLDAIQKTLLLFVILNLIISAWNPYFHESYKTWKHTLLKAFLISFSIYSLFKKPKHIYRLCYAFGVAAILFTLVLTYHNFLDFQKDWDWTAIRANWAYYQYFRTLSAVIIITTGCLLLKNKPWVQLLLYLCLILCLINIYAMSCRTMIILSVGIIITWIALNIRNNRKILTLALTTLAIMILLLAATKGNRFRTCGIGMHDPRVGIQTIYLHSFSQNLDIFQKLFGVGLSDKTSKQLYNENLRYTPLGEKIFQENYQAYKHFNWTPHSGYIETLFSSGIIGLGTLLLIFTLCLYNSIKALYKPNTTNQALLKCLSWLVFTSVLFHQIIAGIPEGFDIVMLGLTCGLSSIIPSLQTKNARSTSKL